jgi:hypothetical protein
MLVEIVTAAAAGLKPDDRDGAALALALTYAGLIDNAAPAAKYAAALRWVNGHEDRHAEKYAPVIEAALSAHSVASDLGPKLLAALESLQLTPRARAAAQNASTGDKPSANPIDQLAHRRRGRAQIVDATTEGPF